MKNTLLDIKYALNTVWYYKKSVYLLHCILLCWGVIYSLTGVIAPARIVNSIYPDFQLKNAVLMVAIWCLILLSNGTIIKRVKDLLSISALKIVSRVKAHYGKAVVDIPYEKLENAKTLDEIEFAKKNISGGCEYKTASSLFSMIQSLISIVLILDILLRLSWLYFAIIVLITVLETVIKSIVDKKRYDYDSQHENASRKMNYAIWGLTDSDLGKEVRLYGLMNYVQNRFDKERNAMYKELSGRSAILARYYFVPSLTVGILYLSVYGLTAYSLYTGDITVSDFVLFTGGTMSLYQLVSSFAKSMLTINEQSRYIDRSKDLFAPIDDEDKLDIDTDHVKIEFRNVWFKYPGQQDYALKDVNFTLEGIEKIAVVGKNGSGKSTFIKLMIGLYKPTKGTIYINSVCIDKVNESCLHTIFAPVFQDYFLTAYSVRENLIFDNAMDNDNSIYDALSQVGVEKAVEALPGGLGCSLSKAIDENGCELSGGESQKIALARAILKKSSVFILDEPTAALSPNAEYEIYKNFQDISKNKATILISHRFAVCTFCDRILVFDNGAIVEQGTHNELLALRGKYYDMYDKQASYYKEEIQ